MATGTVEFGTGPYVVGNTLRIDFSWSDAKFNFKADAYATCSVYDPVDGFIKQEVISDRTDGSDRLNVTANLSGLWHARLRIWDGSSWTDLSSYTTVYKSSDQPDTEPPDVEPPAPSPVEIPDFWADPVGFILYTTLSGFETLLGWVSGSFLTVMSKMHHLVTDYGRDIISFFDDIPGAIQNAITQTIPTLADWWDDILAGIQTWYNDNVKGIIDTISGTVTNVGSWIDNSFNTIGDWWNSVQDSVGSWLSNKWNDISEFWGDITRNITDWWNSTSADVQQWISDAAAGASAWIDTSFSSITDWWSDQWNSITLTIQSWIDDAGSWITSSFTDFISWLNQLPGDISDYIGTQISDLTDYINDTIPGMVENMFEWAKPIINPIIDAAGFLETISGFLTGSAPEDPRLTEHRKQVQQKRDEIKQIIGGR